MTPLLVMGEQNSLNGSMVHRLPPLVCRPGHWPVAISLRSTFNDRESWTLHTEAYNAIDLSCLTGPARTSIDLLTRPSTDRVTVIGSRAFSVVSFKQWQVGPSPGGLRVQGPELQAKKNLIPSQWKLGQLDTKHWNVSLQHSQHRHCTGVVAI